MVTTVSRATRQRLLDWVDLAPERVRVLPNTVGDRLFAGSAVDGLAPAALASARGRFC